MEPPRQESSDFEVMERFSPPAASLKKRISPPIAWNLGLSSPKEPKLYKVLLLGLQGVGKTALAVRFATKRFIGEYDCSTERIYKVDNFLDASWELTDPPGFLPPPTEFKLRLADAIILVYSVSDRVSFDETYRLRFLVSHAKKTRKVPPVVVLIGNKSDLSYTPGERVVSTSEGRQRAEQIEAHSFHEISVRESVEQAQDGACAGGLAISNFFLNSAISKQSTNETRLKRSARNRWSGASQWVSLKNSVASC
ncbi:ras-related and estrogen-regulated growth inhibitor isoform X2 [Augochlora pura]